MVGRLKMTLKSRLLILEKVISETSRSPVTWAAIVDGHLVRLALRNGSILTGPEGQQALDEAQRKRDPYKVYLFDPNDV
jgi:hypothetical protein